MVVLHIILEYDSGQIWKDFDCHIYKRRYLKVFWKIFSETIVLLQINIKWIPLQIFLFQILGACFLQDFWNDTFFRK